MTASSPSAAARRSTSARSSPSCPARRGRSGTSRTSATGGRAPTPRASRRSSPCRPPPAPAPRSAAPRVITDPADHTKKIIFHPLMLPKVVIADPELTVGLPPKITAGTGMDALATASRPIASPSIHPLAEGIALEGMRLVFKEWLPGAVEDGDRCRGARPHAGRRLDGRGRLPEGARRDARAVAIRSARSTTPITA